MTKYLPISIFMLTLLSSCVESFNIETNNSPPVIVIYGCLTNETAFHSVKVSASSPYFDTVPNKGISNATVTVTSSENSVFHFKETDSVPGLYLTVNRETGIPGTTYSLSVEVDFDNDGVNERYTALSTMPDIINVDSIEVKKTELMGYKFFNLLFFAQDPPDENYYLGKYRINDSAVLSSINRFVPMQDAAFNGQYINGQVIQRFWDRTEKERLESDGDDDEYARGRVYLSSGDTVTFSLCHIEKDYYNFINQCQNEMNGENPFFGGPAANIITNISNGGRGFFTSYPVSVAKATAE